MCYGCWKENGSPKIINDKTKMVLELIKEVYKYTCYAGNAHIVFDDWNIDNIHIESCIKDANKDKEGSEGQILVEKKALNCFLNLSREERLSVLAIYEGY